MQAKKRSRQARSNATDAGSGDEAERPTAAAAVAAAAPTAESPQKWLHQTKRVREAAQRAPKARDDAEVLSQLVPLLVSTGQPTKAQMQAINAVAAPTLVPTLESARLAAKEQQRQQQQQEQQAAQQHAMLQQMPFIFATLPLQMQQHLTTLAPNQRLATLS